MMKNLSIAMAVALSILACGVKEKGTQLSPVSGPSPAPGKPAGGLERELPAKVEWTSKKQFLLYLSKREFAVIEEKLRVRVLTSDLQTLPADYQLKFSYWMPEMPQMPVTPIKIESFGNGEKELSYDISMPGKWEFIFEVYKGAELVDNFTLVYQVAE